MYLAKLQLSHRKKAGQKSNRQRFKKTELRVKWELKNWNDPWQTWFSEMITKAKQKPKLNGFYCRCSPSNLLIAGEVRNCGLSMSPSAGPETREPWLTPTAAWGHGVRAKQHCSPQPARQSWEYRPGQTNHSPPKTTSHYCSLCEPSEHYIKKKLIKNYTQYTNKQGKQTWTLL